MERKEGIKVKGRVIVRSHPAGTIHLYETLVAMGRLELARELLADGKIEVDQKNLVVASLNYGFDVLVQYLISAYTGSFAFPLGIAWGEIGTGSTTPTTADTALTTPTNRTSITYAADLGFAEAPTIFTERDIIAPGLLLLRRAEELEEIARQLRNLAERVYP
jgi:hypothetical protein